MKKVQELYPNENFTVDFSFHRKLSIGLGGDLARMLMIHKKVRDTYPKVKRYKKCAKRVAFDVAVSGVGAGKHHKPRLESCSRAKLKAIIFCDSFITYIRPYFSENFSEVLYLRKGYSQQNIEELLESFKPDIVIEELVERNYFKSVTEDKKNDTAKQ